MTERVKLVGAARWMIFGAVVLANLAWVLWTWADPTWNGVGPHQFRAQLATDHAAAIVFAVGRAFLALGVLYATRDW